MEETAYGPHGMIEKRNFKSYVTEFKFDGAGRLVWSLESAGQRRRLIECERGGANQLHEVVTTDYTDGQISTTVRNKITYNPRGRTRADVIDSRGISWIFDRHGRLEDSSEYYASLGGLTVTAGTTRKFHYGADDRLIKVEVRTRGFFGSSVEGPLFLYDGFGRRVARIGGEDGDDLAGRPREVFVFDGPRCILEYDEDGAEIRRYVYDEMGQVVDYRYKEEASVNYQNTLPLTLIDGSPWLILDRRIDLTELPPAPGANGTSDARMKYYIDNLPMILERHVWRPFERPRILPYDYSSGQAEEDDDEDTQSVLPLQGGRRIHSPERLIYNLSRFYESELQGFITPDRGGAWADPLALGNPYTYAANNPVMLADDGQVAFLLPVLVPALVGMALGGGIGYSQGGWEGAFIGAASGAVAGATFAPALAATGFAGGIAAIALASGASGLAGGAVGGAISGGFGAYASGGSVGSGIAQGALVGGASGLAGGLLGGLVGGRLWAAGQRFASLTIGGALGGGLGAGVGAGLQGAGPGEIAMASLTGAGYGALGGMIGFGIGRIGARIPSEAVRDFEISVQLRTIAMLTGSRFRRQGVLIGKVVVPDATSENVRGLLIEDPIRQLVAGKLGFQVGYKEPSANGRDLVVPEAMRQRIGLSHLEIKPLNEQGVRQYFKQLDDWFFIEKVTGRAALLGYDDEGNVYLSHIQDF